MFDRDAVARDAAELLHTLVRIDSSHPPENDFSAADAALSFLLHRHAPAALHDPASGRPMLVGRIASGRGRSPLSLVASLGGASPATPRAEGVRAAPSPSVEAPASWTALPCAVALLTAFTLVSSRRLALSRDIVLVATSGRDLESSRAAGAFLAKEAGVGEAGAGGAERGGPKVGSGAAGFAIGSGGSGEVHAGRAVFEVDVADKARLHLRLSTRESEEEAGTPGTRDARSVFEKALERLDGYAFPLRPTETVERCLVERDREGLLPDGIDAGRILSDPLGASAERLLAGEPRLGASLRDTVARLGPTASGEVECRVLSDRSPGSLVADLATVLAVPGLRIEIVRAVPGSESPFDTPLRDVIGKAIRARFPRAALVPGIASAPTPLGELRRRGAVAYGLSPFLSPEGGGPPAADPTGAGPSDAASIESLRAAIALFYDVVAEFCTS